MLSLVVAAALFTGAQEQLREPDQAERSADAAAARQAEDERVICRRERVLGSNRPQRVCMTRRERTELRDAARNIHDRVMQETPSSTGAAPY